jgi:diguanylate cyclase (GGDEF)-like protein/PAS domain S-box-containing protein
MFKFLQRKRIDLESHSSASCDSASVDPAKITIADTQRYNDELTSAIFKCALDAIITINDKGEILGFNPSAEKIFEYSFNEVVGKNIAEIIIPPNLRKLHKEGLHQFLVTGKKKLIGSHVQINAMRSSGEEFPIEMTLTETNLNNDRLFTAFIRDINALTKTKGALKESENKFRNLIEGSLQGIFVHKEFKPLFANQRCADIYGYENPAEILALDSILPVFWSEEEQERISKLKTDRMAGLEVPSLYQCKGRRKDGTEFWVENHISIVDWQGEKAIQAAVIDISESKHVENELIESEAKFRNSFEYAPFGMGIGDKEGNILQVNNKLCEFSGHSQNEILNKNFREFLHPDEIELAGDNIKKLFSGEIEYYQQVRQYLHKQGHYIWVDISVSVINDAQGNPLFLINHLQDITERKKTEHAIQNYNRSLKVLNQCNDILIHATEVSDLLSEVCNILVDTGGYRFAWVGIAQSDKSKTIIPMAKAGYESGYLNSKISWAAQEKYFCPVTEAIINLRPEAIRNIKTESRNIIWRDAALERGYLSTIALPMKYNDQAFGAIVIYSSEQDVFNEEEINLLVNLTDNVAYGIQSINNKYIRDISEKSLRVSEKNFRTLFDENPCMFFTVDEETIILAVNKFGAAELGYETEDIVGRSFLSFIGKGQTLFVTGHLKHCLKYPDDIQRWEMEASKKDGTKFWIRVLAKVANDYQNKNTILVVCEDITESRMLSDELVYQATHDGLTGLINRHEFETRLQRALLSAQTDNTQHVLCYLDLDRFKIINDTCGHQAGDELLRQLGELLTSKVRHRDSLARLGGDEFGVLIEHCTIEKAEYIANNLKDAVADYKLLWNDKIFKVGVSIGMVEINSSSISTENILMVADNACYTAKDKGRNRIHVHKHGDSELENRRKEMLWTTRIQKAFDEDRFRLVYQPIVPLDLNNRKGEHGEILIRMEDEQGNLITPDAFIPVAERYNLITSIDRHVIDMTFTWLNENPGFLKNLYLCSINLSGSSLDDESVLNFIIQKLSDYEIPANKICFEITETAVIANLNSANHFITVLKKHGCFFALDDFGSGLSSFGYLKALPVDFIKIDGAFVRDIENGQSDLAIVKSIHEIGAALNKETIAEFVENESILNILKGIGVNYAQGYGIERPRPLIEINTLGETNNVIKL